MNPLFLKDENIKEVKISDLRSDKNNTLGDCSEAIIQKIITFTKNKNKAVRVNNNNRYRYLFYFNDNVIIVSTPYEGFISFYKNFIYHRDNDKPAVMFVGNNNKQYMSWFQHGVKKRDDNKCIDYYSNTYEKHIIYANHHKEDGAYYCNIKRNMSNYSYALRLMDYPKHNYFLIML